ncbi:hypothetical protein D9M71_45150 [compost metagenome]
MGIDDLAIVVLQQERAVAVQHAWNAAVQAGRMLAGLDAITGRFNADDLDTLVVQERMEQAHGVGATANARHQAVRQATFLGLQLLAGFLADHGLEVTDHRRVRVRTGHGADQVEGAVDVGHPVTQGFVHCILERAGAGDHRDNLGAQQLHAENVGLLAFDVSGAHVDHAIQAETCSHGGSGHAVHAGAGLGDDALLAHALGQEDLADAVVDLVRAGVVQLFTLEVDLRAAAELGQTLGEVQRAWTSDVVALEVGQFFLECRIFLGQFIFTGQVEDQRHQGFGNVAATERAKQAVGIRAVAQISLGHGALQLNA